MKHPPGKDAAWFSETCDQCGSAFSLKIRAKLHDEKTPYQHLQVYQTETFGRLMVLDGCIMLTGRDNFIYHEMMTHPALFGHTGARRVAIIGGGDCGCLRECLKHDNVEKVTQIDIDEAVTRASEKFFPELCESNSDPRAELLFEDGIDWIKNAAPGSLDLVIIDSTDPAGPAVGLFSGAFYSDCYRALGADGLLVAQSESPLYHKELITGMSAAMRSAGFAEVHQLYFPQCVYPSGWWSATVAGKRAGKFDKNGHRALKKSFKTVYYNNLIHKAALATPEFMK
ncbi:MAG: polyamine aminopropyltransferase [Gammaproteobacteria bacterium]|nr:MAG: polyamine aminopropyltransferase [Gammaproteobacteria bacterium]